MIKIVTDSTAYLTKEEIDEWGVRVVPLSYTLDDITEIEGLPGSFSKYFERLEASSGFPTTSQPSVECFREVFEEELQKDNEVIVIVISSHLSGTYNSAYVASNMTDTSKITIIDSLTTVANMKYMVKLAMEMALQGKTRKEIADAIDNIKKSMRIYLTVDTLEYLKRGGRLSSTQFVIANILNIKPIIELIDGKLEGTHKERGHKKAERYLVEQIPDSVRFISIQHLKAYNRAQRLLKVINNKYEHLKIEINELGPVIGSHLGPGSIGVCVIY